MGFWNDLWNALFGGGASQRPRPRRHRVGKLAAEAPDDDGTFTFTYGDDFYVGGRRSPGGRFIVGAADGHGENGRTVSGRVTLIDAATGQSLYKVTMKRATNAHVSDEGIVTVENWKSWGGPLAGDFIALYPTGKRLWTKRYKANIYGSGMTDDGSKVFVSTCNSLHEAHGCKTFLLDVQSGEVIWTRDGFGHVRVQGNDIVIGIDGDQDRDGNRFFVLDAEGRTPPEYDVALAERERQRAAEVERQNRGKPWWTLPRVAAGLKDAEADLEALAQLLDEMEGSTQELSDSERAKAERYRGEIAERRGELQETRQHWERAIALDPQVGIKRRLTALRKKLG